MIVGIIVYKNNQYDECGAKGSEYCCNGIKFNSDEKFCFDRKLYEMNNSIMFCQGKSYDPNNQGCCEPTGTNKNKFVKPFGYLVDYPESIMGDCGGKCYDTTKYTCEKSYSPY
jgi:hypothetical protein